LYSRNKQNWFKVPNIRKANKLIKIEDGTYWTVGEDKEGKLVVLRSTDRITWKSFNKNLRCVAMNNITYNDIEIDEKGRNLWIATNDGIMQFNFKLEFCNWYKSTRCPELKMKEVNSLAIQNDSTIWISNYDGKLYKMDIYPDTYEEDFLEKLKNVREGRLDVADLAQNLQKKEVPSTPNTPEPPVATKEEPVEKVPSKFSRKKQSLVNLEDIVCGETYELSDLFFIKNTAKFISHAKANDYLSILVTYLETNPAIDIELYGHTDFLSNNKEYLYKLSTDRVKTVKEYLVENGIKKRRIKTQAFGGDQPIITDRVTKDRNQNRRVEVKINCE